MTAAAATYAIRVDGHLDDHWSSWLGELALARELDGSTTIVVAVADQARLHGVLAGLRDIGAAITELRTIAAPAAEPTRPFRRPAQTTIRRLEHVGVVVRELAAATAFFVELGLELRGQGAAEGGSVARVVGVGGGRVEIALLETPDGQARLELARFHAPPHPDADADADADVSTNALGIRHIAFAVVGIDAVVARLRAHGAELVGEVARDQDGVRLCTVRGPEGIILELAEQAG